MSVSLDSQHWRPSRRVQLGLVVEVIREQNVQRRLVIAVTSAVHVTPSKLTVQVARGRNARRVNGTQEPPANHSVVQLETQPITAQFNYKHSQSQRGTARNTTNHSPVEL